jgi:hypothetical protein
VNPTDTRAIEHFVRGTLGCKCPDAVFKTITISHDLDPETATAYTRLLIGDRLVIYVLDAEHAKKLSTVMSTLMTRGVTERNAGGLNRFRLVLATAHPTQVLADAQSGFANAPDHDDHTHLHVIATDQLPDALRSS